MDIGVLVMLLIFSLVLTILGFMGNKPGWALLIIFGAIIAAITTEALLIDGNLTQTTSSTQTLAAANGDFLSDFNAISVMPILITIGELVIGIRRIFKI